MRFYHHTAFAVRDRYFILYGGHKGDAGVGCGLQLPPLVSFTFSFKILLNIKAAHFISRLAPCIYSPRGN
jgi:hypothetical protein